MGTNGAPPLELPTGKRVQWLRKKHGWTQDELGRRSGLSGARIAKLEALRTIPRQLDDLYAVAGALGVNITVLTEREKPKKAVVSFPH